MEEIGEHGSGSRTRRCGFSRQNGDHRAAWSPRDHPRICEKRPQALNGSRTSISGSSRRGLTARTATESPSENLKSVERNSHCAFNGYHDSTGKTTTKPCQSSGGQKTWTLGLFPRWRRTIGRYLRIQGRRGRGSRSGCQSVLQLAFLPQPTPSRTPPSTTIITEGYCKPPSGPA